MNCSAAAQYAQHPATGMEVARKTQPPKPACIRWAPGSFQQTPSALEQKGHGEQKASPCWHWTLEGQQCPPTLCHAEVCPKVQTHLLPTSGGRTDLQLAPKAPKEAALPHTPCGAPQELPATDKKHTVEERPICCHLAQPCSLPHSKI